MYKCDFCGSAFGDRVCYFCEKNCCTSCMIDDRTRCKQCYIYKRRLGWKRLVKKNKVVLIFVGFLWLYAVFPGPLIPGLDPGFYVISIVAAVLIIIPIRIGRVFRVTKSASISVKKRKD